MKLSWYSIGLGNPFRSLDIEKKWIQESFQNRIKIIWLYGGVCVLSSVFVFFTRPDEHRTLLWMFILYSLLWIFQSLSSLLQLTTSALIFSILSLVLHTLGYWWTVDLQSDDDAWVFLILHVIGIQVLPFVPYFLYVSGAVWLVRAGLSGHVDQLVLLLFGYALATVLWGERKQSFKIRELHHGTASVYDMNREKFEDVLKLALPRDKIVKLKFRTTDFSQISDDHPMCVVLFCSFRNFFRIYESMDKREQIKLLSDVFLMLDQLTVEYQVEKIKTIGVKYMLVVGLSPIPDPCDVAANFALSAHQQSTAFQDGLEFRIGMHTGSLVSGIVGSKRWCYDVWGDTVNVSARMESYCPAGATLVTEAFRSHMNSLHNVECVFHGKLDVKGKGRMSTYTLTPKGRESDVMSEGPTRSPQVSDTMFPSHPRKKRAFSDPLRRISKEVIVWGKHSLMGVPEDPPPVFNALENPLSPGQMVKVVNEVITFLNDEEVSENETTLPVDKGCIEPLIALKVAYHLQQGVPHGKQGRGTSGRGNAEKALHSSSHVDTLLMEVDPQKVLHPFSLKMISHTLEVAYNDSLYRKRKLYWFLLLSGALGVSLGLMLYHIMDTFTFTVPFLLGILAMILMTSFGIFFLRPLYEFWTLNIDATAYCLEHRFMEKLQHSLRMANGLAYVTHSTFMLTATLVGIALKNTALMALASILYAGLSMLSYQPLVPIAWCMTTLIVLFPFIHAQGTLPSAPLMTLALVHLVAPLMHATAERNYRTSFVADLAAARQWVLLMMEQKQTKMIHDAVFLGRDPRARIIDEQQSATVLNMDIVGFTVLSSSLEAADVVQLVNTLFTTFDRLCGTWKAEKIGTVGDAYVAAGNLTVPLEQHAHCLVHMALSMKNAVDDINEFHGVFASLLDIIKENPHIIQEEEGHQTQTHNRILSIRIGVATGSLVGGLIGYKLKLNYNLFGEAVEEAERLESLATPQSVLISKNTYEHIQDDKDLAHLFSWDPLRKAYPSHEGNEHLRMYSL